MPGGTTSHANSPWRSKTATLAGVTDGRLMTPDGSHPEHPHWPGLQVGQQRRRVGALARWRVVAAGGGRAWWQLGVVVRPGI
jgi:hypothetical protein